MKRSHSLLSLPVMALAFAAVQAVCHANDPTGTAFTYQGQLLLNGEAVNDEVDLIFKLFDKASGGNQVGSTLAVNDFEISDGVFTIDLDFGDVFAGEERWLEITVNGNVLSPRQPMMPAPYAAFALNVNGKAITDLNASNLTQGEVPQSVLSGNYDLNGTFAGSFSGDGANLTSLNASNVASGTLSDSRLSSNVALKDTGNVFTAGGNTFQAALTLGTQASATNHAVRADRFIATAGGLVGGGNLTNNRTLSININGVTTDRIANLAVTNAKIADLAVTNAKINDVSWSKVTNAPNFLTSESDPTWSGIASTTSSISRTGNVGIGGTTVSGTTLRVRAEPGETPFSVTSGTADRFRIHSNHGVSIGTTPTPPPNGLYVLGDVGLGTSNPAEKLHIIGNTRAEGPMRVRRLGVDVCSMQWVTNAGEVNTRGPNNSFNTRITHLGGTADHGWISVHDSAGTHKAGMYVSSAGDGIIFGDTKNFRMVNPSDPTTEIWYVSLEGPEAGTYFRGTAMLIAGEGVIHVPQHFRDVASPDGMTIQLTPLSAESKGLAVIDKSLDQGILVKELFNGVGTYEFDFTIKAVRRGYEDYEVIRDRAEMEALIAPSVDEGEEEIR